MQSRRLPVSFLGLLPLIFLGIAGCASGGSEVNSTTGTAWGAATSEMAVRTFMDAANAEDFATMSNLFGTSDGPAVEVIAPHMPPRACSKSSRSPKRANSSPALRQVTVTAVLIRNGVAP